MRPAPSRILGVMTPPPLLALGSLPTLEALLLALAAVVLALGVALGARQRAAASQSDPWRWRWLLWPQLGLVLAVTLVAYTGAFSGGRFPLLRVPGIDKLLHFLAFGSLALGTWFATRGRSVGRGAVRLPLAVLGPLSLALGEELMQAASPHRSADPLDLLADLLGLVAFAWVGRRLTRSAVAGEPGPAAVDLLEPAPATRVRARSVWRPRHTSTAASCDRSR